MRYNLPFICAVGFAHLLVLGLAEGMVLAGDGTTAGSALQVPLRTRVQPYKGADGWEAVAFEQAIDPAKTAIVICDMWDKHWCPSATRRCGAIAEKMAPVIDAAREAGMLIVHCPSDTMKFYQDHPARKRAQAATAVEPPTAQTIEEPKLPIDDSDGGCDDVPAPKMYNAWTRQHPLLSIDESRDVISDNGREVYNCLAARGIDRVIVMGVHTNMCVLGRSFAIRQLSRWGLQAMLVRDLTDTMYDPKDPPHVSHEEGTELVVQHIEKYWCPTLTSDDLLTACQQPK
jgi:nicotinamidase-related amidase